MTRAWKKNRRNARAFSLLAGYAENARFNASKVGILVWRLTYLIVSSRRVIRKGFVRKYLSGNTLSDMWSTGGKEETVKKSDLPPCLVNLKSCPEAAFAFELVQL